MPALTATIDAEIERLTAEIERLHFETAEKDRSVSPGRKRAFPKYDNLPNVVDIEIPKGFVRAPITCPFDPAKGERVAAAERNLKELLLKKNRENTKMLVNEIRQSRTIHSEDAPKRKPVPDETMESVMGFLLAGL